MATTDGTEDPTTGPARRPDESMTLLTALLERPLDPSYQAAADHRVSKGLPPATSWRTPTAIITALLVGALLGVSARTLVPRQQLASPVKAEIIQQIQTRQQEADAGEAQVQALQSEVSNLEQSAAAGAGTGLSAEQLDTLRRVAGTVEVSGPGLVVTLDDARAADGSADGNPRTGVSDDGRVMSKDLQIVANALWAAGAESMAINGQRLTSHTAIRFAGEAILVNFRPLVPPYVVETIGDAKALELAFGAGTGGAYLKTLSSNFGIRTSVETADHLTLPAAAQIGSREATPLRPGESTPPTVRVTPKESAS